MNLPLGQDGFYDLSPRDGAATVYVSPAGSDANDGAAPDRPVKTLKRGMALCRPGKPDRLLLQGGARWQEQLWVNRAGPAPEAPLVIGTYGEKRAVVEAPAGATAMQWLSASGYVVVSDVEFACVPGKPGVRTHAAPVAPGSKLVAEVLYQNVDVHDAGVGVDASSIAVFLHRSIVRDCYEPVSGRSQGVYVTKGLLAVNESVIDYCGWRQGVSVQVQHADENHCVYVDEDCAGPSVVSGSFISRGCSHGLQMRTGGTVDRSVLWRCPIMGFSQGRVGQLDLVYFEQGDAVTLGHGNASAPGDLVRGFGWDGESTFFEANRVAFKSGGSTRGDSRALNLAPAKPGRSPPRTGASVYARGVRIASWPKGLRVTCPPADVGAVEPEEDGKSPRWQPFTVEPYVARIRALDRGGDWTLMTRLAAEGYAALEQVNGSGKVRAVNSTVAKSMREGADALEKVVEP